jgi:hypothetical protein
MKYLALFLAFAMLAACGGAPKRNTELYNQARRADAEQARAEALAESNASAARATSMAALAAKCPANDTACVSALADKMVMGDAIAALKAALQAAAKSNGRQAAIPYERDGFAKFKDVLTGVTPLANVAGSTWLAGKQSDNAREIALGDQATQRAIVSTVAELGAQPTTVAGGDVIGGDRVETNIADSFNDSSDNSTRGDEIAVSGDGSAVGDGNDVVNGDNAYNSGNIGEGNRHGSDGPFDDHSNPGDDCTGDTCQSTNPPPDIEPET